MPYFPGDARDLTNWQSACSRNNEYFSKSGSKDLRQYRQWLNDNTGELSRKKISEFKKNFQH